ncbi:MAG: acylphosphatase [Proteobacteria bacterium]|nr:acylphosphatase [Pseudomonadota bacterium]
MKVCRRCVVSGKVQGVFFRHGTFQKAISLGLTGWVRNLSNGNVECLVCGDDAAVEQLCQWLHQGPPAAKVNGVVIEEAPLQEFQGFTIVR